MTEVHKAQCSGSQMLRVSVNSTLLWQHTQTYHIFRTALFGRCSEEDSTDRCEATTTRTFHGGMHACASSASPSSTHCRLVLSQLATAADPVLCELSVQIYGLHSTEMDLHQCARDTDGVGKLLVNEAGPRMRFGICTTGDPRDPGGAKTTRKQGMARDNSPCVRLAIRKCMSLTWKHADAGIRLPV